MWFIEGKRKEADAKKPVTPEEIAKEKRMRKLASRLLCSLICEQWWLFLLGFPFMFAGSLGEFIVPDYVGRVINALTEKDYDKTTTLLYQWMIFLAVGALASLIREIIFGVTSEKLGVSLRKRLFESVIDKDVGFFDDFKTGDILSRLSSDTTVVTNGLSTSVSMFLKSAGFCVAVLVIMFTYSTKLTLAAIIVTVPIALFTPLFNWIIKKHTIEYQDKKAICSSIAEEALSNIRTVKAFADEKSLVKKYKLENERLYDVARVRNYWRGGWMFN